VIPVPVQGFGFPVLGSLLEQRTTETKDRRAGIGTVITS